MTDQELKDVVNKIFIDEFELDPEIIKMEANIVEDLGLDSLDIVDLVVALEKAFGVKMKSRESLQKIRTIADIHEYIKEQSSSHNS